MPEAVSGVFSVDVANQFSNDLSVGLRLEHKPFASQELLDVLVVGDDAIVNNFINVFQKYFEYYIEVYIGPAKSFFCPSVWGWQLRSEGAPCVAHLV